MQYHWHQLNHKMLHPNTTIDSRTLEQIVHQILLTKQIGPPPGQQLTLVCHNKQIMTHHSHRPYETPTPPHVYVNQQLPNQTPFDFNQSIDTLNKIAKSSSFKKATFY